MRALQHTHGPNVGSVIDVARHYAVLATVTRQDYTVHIFNDSNDEAVGRLPKWSGHLHLQPIGQDVRIVQAGATNDANLQTGSQISNAFMSFYETNK